MPVYISIFSRTIIIFISLCVFNLFSAVEGLPHKTKPIYAAIAVDADSGKVLYQYQADTITPPASLTKIMTLLMLFDALEQGKLRLTDMIPISRHAASQQPCKLGLKPGGYISVQNVILGIVTKSANDAAAAMAEFLGGTECAFAEYMTQRARQFGMMHTTFKNASGLPAIGQSTNARDMAILGLVTQKHYKKYFHLFGVREFCYNNLCHVNHNYRLLSNKQLKFDGIKTGYVGASGFNVIASHQDKGRRMIVVVMGGATPAWRDKRVVEIVQRAKALTPVIYVAKASSSPTPSLKTTAHTVQLSKKSTLTAINQANTNNIVVVPDIEKQSTVSYSLLLGYYGSQLRAKTVAKQALTHANLNNITSISTKRIRVSGRYLYQASIDNLSKQQVEQASAILRYLNIDSSVIEQPS
jgi:D-alanyl-D-alanine carboxypeptidase